MLNINANGNWKSKFKSLDLGVPPIIANYAKYITDYNSSQADTLQLGLKGVELYNLIDDIGMDNDLNLWTD